MTSRDFCFWLQGFFELTTETDKTNYVLNTAQSELIKKHLALVFKHEIDPSMGSKPHQDALNMIHDPAFKPVKTNDPLMRC